MFADNLTPDTIVNISNPKVPSTFKKSGLSKYFSNTGYVNPTLEIIIPETLSGPVTTNDIRYVFSSG